MHNMLDLLKTEYLKFKRAGVIRMMAILYVIISPIVIIAARDVLKSIPKNVVNVNDFTEFPSIWDYQGYVMSFFVAFLLGYMVLYTITSEVRNKTMRQNILSGYTRKEYFTAKLLIVTALSIMATLYYILTTVIIGALYTEGWDMTLLLDTNWAPIRFFIMCLGHLLFALLIGILLGKGTLSVFVYFSYLLILEPFLRYVIHLRIINNSSINYWPLNALEDNMPNPLLRIPDNFLRNNDFNFDVLLDPMHAAIAGTLYCGLFILAAWGIFKRKDL